MKRVIIKTYPEYICMPGMAEETGLVTKWFPQLLLDSYASAKTKESSTSSLELTIQEKWH